MNGREVDQDLEQGPRFRLCVTNCELSWWSHWEIIIFSSISVTNNVKLYTNSMTRLKRPTSVILQRILTTKIRETKTAISQKFTIVWPIQLPRWYHVKRHAQGFGSDFITLPHSFSIDGKGTLTKIYTLMDFPPRCLRTLSSTLVCEPACSLSSPAPHPAKTVIQGDFLPALNCALVSESTRTL